MIKVENLPSPIFRENAGDVKMGDLINVSPDGSIVIGSNSGPTITLNNGNIVIGSPGAPSQIQFNGSIGFKYNAITNHSGALYLDSSYYFIEIFDPNTNPIILPKCNITLGGSYIISNCRENTPLIVNTNDADTIDGSQTISLEVKNQRITVISNGLTEWIII